MAFSSPLEAEWLEADGLGGFASGTVSTVRSRRYHAWLLAATTPPTGRFVLVNGADVWIESQGRRTFLSSQHYLPGEIPAAPPPTWDAFWIHPWPTWRFRLPSGTTIRQELFAVHERPLVIVRWSLDHHAGDETRLVMRPLFSGRDYHALHRENEAFGWLPRREGQALVWSPYPGVPDIIVLTNGSYIHQPAWYRHFLYTAERDRGLDFQEDLAAPGTFSWDLRAGAAALLLTTDRRRLGEDPAAEATSLAEDYASQERRRRGRFASELHRAADAYVVRRGSGQTLIAGYPWFTDWGRDTFIALRGLCLAAGRFDVAAAILLNWSRHVSQGMLPNRFPDSAAVPEYNSVDASLWYVNTVGDFLRRAPHVAPEVQRELEAAVDAILHGYARGTRFDIRMDADGLIAAGRPGVQLTWMDAKVGDWIVTPRIGKPVEVQALWLNALHAFRRLSQDYDRWFREGRDSFRRRFWNSERKCLFDVVDVDHEPGRIDLAVRPNQIFAVGGLPLVLLDPSEAKAVVDCVEHELLTPWGLRTLSPSDSAYRGRFSGGIFERDAAYHQGTVWPWLLGAFVEAWLRVHGDSEEHRRVARERFLKPMEQHLSEWGLGHLAEVADGDPPHRPGGCPFQAWSLGEFLRLKWDVLHD